MTTPRRATPRFQPGLAGPLAAATVGFAAGYLTIRIGADNPSWHNADGSTGFVFADDTAIQTWALLIAGEVAMWAVLAAPIIGWCRQAQPSPPDRGYRIEVGLVIVLFLLMVLVPQMLAPDAAMPIHHYYGRIRGLSVLACLVIAPGLAGFVAIRRRATRTSPGDVDLPLLRTIARQILFAIGSVISAALLATGLASKIIHDRDPADRSLTHDLVLLYGLLFSGLLALVFVPTYTAIDAAIHRRSSTTAGAATATDGAPDRTEATEPGDIPEVSALRMLSQYVFVLSPLMSAVVAGFLGT